MSARVGSKTSTSVVVPLTAAVFFSGAAALVYETVWTRSFAIVLGSTVEAASATFAAFLVGLAIGAWLLGRRAPPLRFTIYAYMAVELVIGLLGPLCGVLLHRNADALALVIGAGPGPRVLWAFGTVLVIVLLPTIAIGGTFPLMLNAARRLGSPITAIGRLYAVNTLGAALGTLSCGFLFFRLFGVSNSLWLGSMGNLAAVLLCIPLLRKSLENEAALDSEPAFETVPDRAVDPGFERAPESMKGAPGRSAPISEGLLLSVAAASGAVILGLEVVWTRLASYFLGNRIYAFTTLLACVLVLLAMGSWVASRLVERSRNRDRLHELFGWILVSATGCTLFSATAAWWWIRNQEQFEPFLPGSADLLFLYRVAETFLLLAPSLLCLGCLFPMSLMCSKNAGRLTARTAGHFYAANTAGSVVGSLGIGFWGTSVLGAFGSTAILVWVVALLALAVFGASLLRERRHSTWAGVGSVIALLLAVPFILPETIVMVPEGHHLAYRREDAHGVMQVIQLPGGITRVTNNRTALVYPLGLSGTSYVQEMQAHLALFHRPESTRAVVIGNGYGVTAGAFTRYPSIQQIDAVEILPGLFEAAELFEPYTYGYQRDPRVNLVVDDGRHFMARSNDRYDVVSVNVTDPRLPGASSLCHVEFYDIVKRHMVPGGILVQHVFGEARIVVVKTLLESFAYVRLFPSYGNGYNAIASDEPLDRNPAQADSLLEIAAVRKSLRGIGLIPPITPSLILQSAIERAEIERWIHPETPIATDDHPVTEFAWDGVAGLLFSND